MKRFVMILLAVCLVLSLVACSTDGNTDTSTNGTDSGDTQVIPQDLALFGGDNDYRIVYSSTATTALKEMLVDLSENVKTVTGKAPTRVADNSKKDTEVAREILVAATNRAQSEESMSKITGIGYRVEFIGEKLLITASNDTMLKLAVEAFMNAWTIADGKIAMPNTTVLAEDFGDSMLPICENGKLRYNIIIQASAEEAIHQAANSLASRLSSLTGSKVDVSYDTMVADNGGTYEICIGNTNRTVSQSLYSELESSFEYKAKIEGSKIAVAAKSTEALIKGISVFTDDLCAAISGTYCGNAAIAKDYSINASIMSSDFQLPQSGTLSKTVNTGDDDEFVYYYDNVTENDYSDYVTLLTGAGCTVKSTYTMGANKYTLMENSDYHVYVAYLSKVEDMRIVLDKASDVYPEPAAPQTQAVCTPSLWQLQLDTKAAQANGGMSYVIQLTDGTFVVVDGGYSSDAKGLYQLLNANKKGNGKPVISAWIITHLHNDHYGALKGITNNYKNNVEVKAFYYNFPGIQCGDVGSGNAKDIENYMKKWSGAKMYGKLHSGMTFSVVDAKFTVICSYEDVFPQTIENGNDTSTVIKAEVGGQSIMFLGDAYYKESAVMTSQIDASVLKSDMVQVSHHGYEGCTYALYAAVNPSVALWPMPIVGFKNNAVFKEWYEGSHNTYIKNNTSSVKKIIVSGAGTEKLSLPYTPSGERIINYTQYYNDNKE